MDARAYQDYLKKFNARDYDGVFDYFSDQPDMAFFGVRIQSREELKKFYGFLHSYIRETITAERIVCDAHTLALEAVVRLEGIRDLDAQTLTANGCAQFHPIKAGQVIELKQYIHYHLDDAGKIVSVGCALVG
jgi:hypothetical protein